MTMTKNINKEMYVKMKSRNLKAIFATLSAVAVMATAMTGFAAATTTYDATNNKVEVTETVYADANSEVTYLVKSNDQIVYIDQTTADATTGAATFTYKIAGDKIVNLDTAVTYGTDGTEVREGSPALALKSLPNDVKETYTITYSKSIIGNNDTVTATIAAVGDNVIKDVAVNGNSKGAVSSVEVGYDDVITVTTEEKVQAPTISASVGEIVKEEFEGVERDVVTSVITYTGKPTSVGVVCGDYYYPAKTAPNAEGKVAVKLILPDGADKLHIYEAFED